jgi:hypothetical protein
MTNIEKTEGVHEMKDRETDHSRNTIKKALSGEYSR